VPDEPGNYKIRNGDEAIPVVGMRLPHFARNNRRELLNNLWKESHYQTSRLRVESIGKINGEGASG